jgi:hypothetical protein
MRALPAVRCNAVTPGGTGASRALVSRDARASLLALVSRVAVAAGGGPSPPPPFTFSPDVNELTTTTPCCRKARYATPSARVIPVVATTTPEWGS